MGFNCIYTVEFLLKIIALGKKYFHTTDANWNIFDLVVVTAGWIGFIVEELAVDQKEMVTLFIIIRACRISRLFKLVKRMKSLRI